MVGQSAAKPCNMPTTALLAISLLLFAVSSCLAIPAIDIAAGSNFALAVLSDRSIVAWGDNSAGQWNVPTGVAADKVSAGKSHAMALLTDGECVLSKVSAFY